MRQDIVTLKVHTLVCFFKTLRYTAYREFTSFISHLGLKSSCLPGTVNYQGVCERTAERPNYPALGSNLTLRGMDHPPGLSAAGTLRGFPSSSPLKTVAAPPGRVRRWDGCATTRTAINPPRLPPSLEEGVVSRPTSATRSMQHGAVSLLYNHIRCRMEESISPYGMVLRRIRLGILLGDCQCDLKFAARLLQEVMTSPS
ncbi:hypothetical protein H4582DRAFT_1203150 [Lactarius indigo]|nr:hypothetical protein H4582DRAFT_1203150 [Lactarius indigo]